MKRGLGGATIEDDLIGTYTAILNSFNPLSVSVVRNIDLTRLLALFLGCNHTSPAPLLPLAFVVKIHDGDTITVVSHGASQRVRLAGIDCPESDQPYGAEATDAQRLPMRLDPPYF